MSKPKKLRIPRYHDYQLADGRKVGVRPIGKNFDHWALFDVTDEAQPEEVHSRQVPREFGEGARDRVMFSLQKAACFQRGIFKDAVNIGAAALPEKLPKRSRRPVVYID